MQFIIPLARSKEFFTVYSSVVSRDKTELKYLANTYVVVIITDKIVRNFGVFEIFVYFNITL